MFYDGATPPEGIFDDFQAIPSVTDNTGTKSFTELITAFNDTATGRHVMFIPEDKQILIIR